MPGAGAGADAGLAPGGHGAEETSGVALVPLTAMNDLIVTSPAEIGGRLRCIDVAHGFGYSHTMWQLGKGQLSGALHFQLQLGSSQTFLHG